MVALIIKKRPRRGLIFCTGDLGGIRTRDCLDENQESWTARRRDRKVIIAYFLFYFNLCHP